MVDSAEEERLDEAKVELWRTMKYQDNKDIPLLVLANKQDLQSALSAADIEDALGKLRHKACDHYIKIAYPLSFCDTLDF